MVHRIRRPSAAFVLSVVSLFVALGGAGYAALAVPAHSVGARQLKDGAVTDAKVKAHSLTGRALNLAKLGTVPAAETAATATTATTATTASSAGAAPIAKVSYVVAQVAIPVTTVAPTRGTASCPAGTVVTGGGAVVGDELDGLVNDSASNSTSGWVADFVNFGSGPITGAVEAICAPAAATSP